MCQWPLTDLTSSGYWTIEVNGYTSPWFVFSWRYLHWLRAVAVACRLASNTLVHHLFHSFVHVLVLLLLVFSIPWCSGEASPTIWSCYANFSVFIDCENNPFLQKWIMIMILNLHSMTKLSGWIRYCPDDQHDLVVLLFLVMLLESPVVCSSTVCILGFHVTS